MRGVLIAVLLAGCGRLQFDSHAHDDASAGSADAATDAHIFDAAPDGVLATTCGTFGSLACDGFETGSIDPMWMLDTSAGTIALDASRAYRGSASVHVHINTISASITNPRALLLGPAGIQTPVTGMIYFRVWMYVSSPVFSVTLMNQLINAANQAGQGISMGLTNHLVANNDYTAGNYMESTTQFPLDRWTCVQFEIPSNIVGTSRVFIDGAELTDIALTNTSPQPAPDHVYIGLEWVGSPSSMPAADAWVDEIIVDTSPTTCAQ